MRDIATQKANKGQNPCMMHIYGQGTQHGHCVHVYILEGINFPTKTVLQKTAFM